MRAATTKASVLKRARAVEVMIFDVDGVLTDGGLVYGPDGELAKRFNVLDGMGIVMLREAGIQVAIISGRNSPIVQKRAEDLGIELVIQGVSDKSAALDKLHRTLGTTDAVIGYMGDDWIDISLLRRAALAATVPNAASRVAKYAHWISTRAGGDGAARELCEVLLRAQGKLDAALAAFGA